MKKTVIGLMAIVLTASFLFTLSACGNKKNDTTTAAATTAENDSVSQNITTAAEQTTAVQVATGETTTTAGTTSVAGETTTKAGTTAPVTAAEIVSYYNAAANKAKADKPGYTLVTTNVIGDITSSYGSIQWLAGKVVPMFSTDPITTTVSKGDSSLFPVKGQSYGGKVEVSSLKDTNGAVIADKGTAYEITLNFKDEKLSDLPSDVTKVRHGQAFNLLTKDLVNVEIESFSWIVKIVKFAPTYTGCYVNCKIDKATGNLKNATYYCVNKSDVEAKVGFTTFDANVFFGNKEEYTLNY